MIKRKDILSKSIDNLKTNYFNLLKHYEKIKLYKCSNCEELEEEIVDLVNLREEMRIKIIFLGRLDIIRFDYVNYLIKIFKLNTMFMI